MKKTCHLLFLLFFLSAAGAFAQSETETPGWNFPKNEKKNKIAREKNALYTDALKAENYQEAKAHLSWLLQNNPELNESIYINGAKIYENLAENVQDEQQAQLIADSAILLYDLRIKYFNEREEVLNRKALAAYKLWRDRQEKYPELYQLMQEAFEANGTEFWPQNAVAYMDAARRHKVTGGEVSDLDIINLYDSLDTTLKQQTESGGDAEKIKVMREQLDKILVGTISTECDDIENNLGSLFRERPDNLKLAKVIIKLSFAAECTDNPAFNQAAQLVQEKQPSVGLARLLASKALESGDFEQAVKFFENAIELTEDPLQKAGLLLGIAEIHSKEGRKSSARQYAQQALEADPNLSSAYTLIGNMYFNSYEECRKNQSQVEDRLVFIAAYNMYERAGNREMMAQARQQFPTVGMLFDENREAGQQMTVGCWINRTVTLRQAPKQ
jgi:tetratricopeptide (TPR) repeat protein